MLKARMSCECIIGEDTIPDWNICGTCWPMIFYRTADVLSMESNAARGLYNKHHIGTPDYFFVAEDNSIIVGRKGIGYIRAKSGEVLETGTIDDNGYWQTTGGE